MIPSKHIADTPIKSVVFDSNGNKITYGSKSGLIYVLETKDLDYVTMLDAHNGSIYALDYTKDGEYLVSGGKDYKINIWPTKHYCTKASGLENNVLNSQYSDRSDPLRQSNAKKNYKTLRTDNIILSIATCYMTNPRIFAYGGLSDNIYVSNTNHPKPQICKAHKQGTCSIKFNPQGTLFASGGIDNIVMLWDLNTLKSTSTSNAHRGRINSILFDRENPFSVVAGSKDNIISIWDIRQNTVQGLIKLKSSVIGLGYDLNGNLISADGEGRLTLWDKKALNKSINKNRPIQKLHKVDFTSLDKSQFLVGIAEKDLQTWRMDDIFKSKRTSLFDRYSISDTKKLVSKLSLSKKNKSIKQNNLASIEENLHLGDDNKAEKYTPNAPDRRQKYTHKNIENSINVSITINEDDFDIVELDNEELDFLIKNENNDINPPPSGSLKNNNKDSEYMEKEGGQTIKKSYIQQAFHKSSPHKSIRDKKSAPKAALKEDQSDFAYKPSAPIDENEHPSPVNGKILNHRDSINKIKEKEQDLGYHPIPMCSDYICTQCCNRELCCNAKRAICCGSSCLGTMSMATAYFYDKIPFTQYIICHAVSKPLLWGFGGVMCLGAGCYCTCITCSKFYKNYNCRCHL